MATRVLLLAALLLAIAPAGALGHAGFVSSDPASGATLGAAPTSVKLTFSERPEPDLSTISVVGAGGATFEAGPPVRVGDTNTLAVRLRPLPRGVYSVRYRVVSAVDGHPSTGAFPFGFGASPSGVSLEAPAATPATSKLEVVARALFLIGLLLLLGAAVAGVAGFGSDPRLGVAGWLLGVIGLGLLAEAQRRSAGVSLGDLLDTEVGDALVRRAAGLALAGIALVLAFAVAGRIALVLTAAAALAVIVVHVAAGHAAAGSWPTGLTVAVQSAHFAAAGVWIGGLAALLLRVRGAPSGVKAAAVRRFSAAAVVALAVVLAAGTVRAIDELVAFDDLVDTAYGRAVLVKVLLFAGLAAFGLRNRRRSVPAAATDLGPLRRTTRGELVLGAGALVVAAVLGALAPAVGGAPGPAGLRAGGEAGGVKVALSTVSAEPGPNTFTARVEGADPATVRLTFTPLDDPGDRTSTLTLTRTGDGTYTGTGPNLRYDGRWGVSAAVGPATVPLELEVPGMDTFATITRPPNQPSYFSKPVGDVGFVSLTLFPERAGRSHVTAGGYDPIRDEAQVESLVLTMQAGDGPVRKVPVSRARRGTFAADVDLPHGDVRFAIVLHTRDGRRMRGTFDVPISAG